MTIFLDGKRIRPDDKMLDDLTPGQRRLRGVFETMHAHVGKIKDINAHLKRLSDGLKCLGLKNPLSAVRWKAVLRKLLKQNPYPHARVRLLVWQENKKLHHAAMVLKYQPPSQKYRRGFRVMTVKTTLPASSRRARVKSLDHAIFANAYQKAAAHGYDEALLLNAKGHVCEASRSNIFIVRGGVLLTPPLSAGCLDGITRSRVIKKAIEQGIDVREQNVMVKDITNSDGAFVTNALIGLMPLASIDGRALTMNQDKRIRVRFMVTLNRLRSA